MNDLLLPWFVLLALIEISGWVMDGGLLRVEDRVRRRLGLPPRNH